MGLLDERTYPVGSKRHTFRTCGEVTYVTSTHGKEFIIDTADIPNLLGLFWSITPRGYVKHSWSRTFLHRHLLKAPDGYVVDHVNHETLDCRRTNLRSVTHTENMHNASLYTSNTSGVTGVGRCGNRWRATIRAEGRDYHLGLYMNFEDAVAARRAAELHYHPYKKELLAAKIRPRKKLNTQKR